MAILDRFVSLFKPKTAGPDILFGRYSDVYKTEAQQIAWNKSMQLFEEDRPLDAYREMLFFMRDEKLDNVQWVENEKGIQFEFWQGSRKVTGFADKDHIKVESRIAWADDLNVGFMRRLVEQNFRLRYTRFALTPDNSLAIVYDSHTRDGSPYKLLQAFRELAINADKQDDILLDEFRTLKAVEEHTADSSLPEQEKKVKIAYVQQEIRAIMSALEVAKPDPARFPGGYVYLMLGTAFRLDYLVRPEGYVMDALEKVYQGYFAKDDRTPAAKVEVMKKIFQRILDRPQEELANELYRTRSTFGINPGVGHDRVQALIDAELPKMDWHIEQKHPEIMTMAIARYAVGYGLYHYAPPPPDVDFLHLFFHITEYTYFRELGYQESFYTPENTLNKAAIESAVRAVADKWRSRFPKLKPRLELLEYSSLPVFARSYLRMVRQTEL
jgi:hypothetical protein